MSPVAASFRRVCRPELQSHLKCSSCELRAHLILRLGGLLIRSEVFLVTARVDAGSDVGNDQGHQHCQDLRYCRKAGAVLRQPLFIEVCNRKNHHYYHQHGHRLRYPRISKTASACRLLWRQRPSPQLQRLCPGAGQMQKVRGTSNTVEGLELSSFLGDSGVQIELNIGLETSRVGTVTLVQHGDLDVYALSLSSSGYPNP